MSSDAVPATTDAAAADTIETPAAHPAPTQPAPTQPAPTQPAPTQPAAPAPASAVLESAPLSSTSRPPSTAPTRRVRGKLARLATPGKTAVAPEIEPILKTVRATHAKADLRPVQRAYEVAEARHRGQTRRSGDAYITHPLAVAGILAELGMDVTTLVAALLHDTVEDTGATIASIEADFGSDVALVVDGVTKLDKVKFGEAAEAETIRKMVIAMARDPRVLVVKLADRLHNMRTLQFLPPEKQERKSREVLEIYAPLAHRLGMNTIKWELEDLAFATLYPKRYDEIARLVSDQAPSRDTFLSEIIERVSAELAGSKIQAEVTGRPKHYYSIYQKMLVRERDFGDIYDLVGVRVTVNSVRDCYAALGAIHAIWNPMPGRFKDYIAMPKFNMYQSLHTTVIGPAGKPVELQIRTSAMHKVAEYGIAAHWKYKESKDAKAVDAELATSAEGTAEMAWLRQILDWQRETSDPGEFLDSLRFDLYAGEVFVFTPKGDVISLPSGATPVD
ncbi:MAG: RelA/SpoT family protein, partial [Frankia sp.]|nr:RelA/SpoT family protein [Frankia sp.]